MIAAPLPPGRGAPATSPETGAAATAPRQPRISFAAYLVTAPFIYSLILPIAVLDLAVRVYQRLCFPAWRIPRVDRTRYIIFDRHRLPYLSALQKFNCSYCAYTNGVLAFVTEVASRTEAFFCPIKHQTPPEGRHRRYDDFLQFGDAAGFRDQQE